ncbi:hypothetical protein CFOL_v3_09919 [Cephalotus follicularis]|uniref:Uncharacterized protein n=1 Tax=Cephalotus follicularis TaxID=3775 RepID=A0A1Q3BET8_CEPFO|nr:hypothetical protein CFOL_v3_09919 [Cephalotus follicularis]
MTVAAAAAAAATARIGERSTSKILRPIWRSTTGRRQLSVSLPTPSLRIPTPTPSIRLLRRELSTFLPVHSAIAAACLVSKLPSEATTSAQGRFANYLSPI